EEEVTEAREGAGDAFGGGRLGNGEGVCDFQEGLVLKVSKDEGGAVVLREAGGGLIDEGGGVVSRAGGVLGGKGLWIADHRSHLLLEAILTELPFSGVL